jgi:hypothetical protein
VARPRSDKKPARTTPAETRILPMQLQIGDGLTDDSGEWEVAGRPYTSAMGKNAHVRVRLVSRPEVTQMRMWAAHERVSVKRAPRAGEEG